jgi:hypothetical protein
MFIVDNPDYKDGKCSYFDTFNPTSIHLSKFDKDTPQTIDGTLLFHENIVIPDTQIFISLSFPFSHIKKIQISTENPLGFTLSHIIETIKNVYQWAYVQEEQTATEKEFTIQTNCTRCLTVSYYTPCEGGDICSICLEECKNENDVNDTNDVNVATKCNHIFHRKCIDTWISGKNEKCPLCRTMLWQCEECNGTKWKVTYYTGKVVPKSLRGLTSRNHTDGVFGIYDFDFEDLFIENMIYNRVTKTLYPKIFG